MKQATSATSAPTLDMLATVDPPRPAPAPDPVALERPADATIAGTFERFLRDPAVDVEKLERLMALWERNEARSAEAAFNVAMSDAQGEMRSVATDATNPQTRSRYASYEALDRALRPIYTAHGFALSFDTGECPIAEWERVLCYVTHRAGHKHTYKLDVPADGKGAKGGDVMTKTHAVASGLSYAMRYLLRLVFNVAVGEGDDDGNRAGATVAVRRDKEQPKTPSGYDDRLSDLIACADEGWPKLSAAFNALKEDVRRHLTTADSEQWEMLKAKARAVKS